MAQSSPNLQLVSLVHLVVPILNGLLSLLIHVNTLRLPYNFVQRVPEGISGNPGKEIQDSADACLTRKRYISY